MLVIYATYLYDCDTTLVSIHLYFYFQFKERIQEGFPSLSVPVGSSVVSIIQNMSGSPPDYHLILEICDFLLLVHPAANTYINHSRSQFYFTLPCQKPPSPLSKLKIGQGIVTSSPVKSTSIANRGMISLLLIFFLASVS